MKGILRSEDRLLMAAAAPGSQELAELAADPHFSWREAHRVALRNRLGSLAWALLEEDPLRQAIDPQTRAQWHMAQLAIQQKDLAARKQLVELTAVLAAAGVQPLLYKGFDFQTRYYRRDRLRSFTDLDLIVGRDEALRADDALRSAGYHLWAGSMPLEYYLRFHLHATYAHASWPMPVELHWALDSPYAESEDRVGPIRGAAITTQEFGPHLLRPAPIDALALMAIHLEKHVGLSAQLPSPQARIKSVIDAGGLLWVADVVAWMRSEGGGDADAIRTRFGALGAERSLSASLRLACDLHARSLPEWACSAAAAVRTHPSLVCRVVYPDLSSNRAVTPLGERIRLFLLTPIPGLTFRPIRILEAIAPGPAPELRRGFSAHIARLARVVVLGAANLLAMARLRLQMQRRSAERS